MLRKAPPPIFFQVILFLLIAILIAACAPAVSQGPQAIADPATPTPGIFSALAPSPTPSDSTLPLTCQVTDLGVYINNEWGYCFAYPGIFTLDETRAAEGIITLYGPALEDNADPVRVSLEIATQPVHPGSALTPLVDAYLSLFQDPVLPTTREPARLGDEAAEMLEPIPGLLSSRVVMAVHSNILFTLRFHPSDIEFAKSGLEDLTQTVTGSFEFLPVPVPLSSTLKTVSWYEFGQNISLSYDSALAPWVEPWTAPAVPVSDQILFAEAHPVHVQIRFHGFQGGRLYDLPLLPPENRVARVMVFRTVDFPGFGDDNPQGFVNQLSALTALLETGVEAARCAQPLTSEPGLPFLPWINMKQTLCAQPQIIEFQNGRGIRYLSYYAQGISSALDREVFYTFQGLTKDGQFYVSALFPVETGIFPDEPPPCPQCGEQNYDPSQEWMAVLTEQLVHLNAQPEDEFAPSLSMLDELIKSIQISQ